MQFLVIGDKNENTCRLTKLLEITFPKVNITVSTTMVYKYFLNYEWDLVIVLPTLKKLDFKAYSKPVLYIVDVSEMDSHIFIHLVKNGIRGIINYDVPLDVLRTGINFVKDGGFFLDPKVAKSIDQIFEFDNKKVKKTYNLTNNQLELLALIAQGLTLDEIAKKLNISRPTVITRKREILKKTRSKTMSEAIAKCIKNGWLYDS